MTDPDQLPPETSQDSTFTHDGQMEITPDGTQIWRGDGPPPEVRAQMEKDANTPQLCMRAGCTKMMPGKGWCSLKHRDEYQRQTYGFKPRPEDTPRFFSRNIPKNISVEIAKGHGYWYEKYQEYQIAAKNAYAAEQAKQLKAQKAAEAAMAAAKEDAPIELAVPTETRNAAAST